MTTATQNPQEAAMQRIRAMLDTTSKASNIATRIMDTALKDAVAFRTSGLSNEVCPILLTQPALVEMQHLKKSLQELVDYYTQQVEAFGKAMGMQANAAPAPEVDPVEQLRIQTEQLAAGINQVEEAPARLDNGTPTVSGARAAAAAQSTLPKPGLPGAVPPAGERLPGRASVPENSIERLLSPQSPLLEIFAPAPWLHSGRGSITVGSPGYQWYKGTYPFTMDAAQRATLPSGFYGGEERPQHAVVRMETCILVWSFELDPDSIQIYMVGASDTDPANPRWFSLSSLSSSFSRRLVQELEALVPQRGGSWK
ncbi:hypothetical protein [Ralstonia phage RP31]|uniref:Uncharacterized protein n=2 Tax=Ripduovirus RP12 TaxID=2560700 RepID=A0A1L7N190_9CAUD|nr:hypothetical protein FDH28_gp155 [Ralstonia phage RP12]BAW19240.1 hypothetical protein [Ralstonia phage RP12]BAW19526.1 hypothetical protein [Ralstonia phage RP31]